MFWIDQLIVVANSLLEITSVLILIHAFQNSETSFKIHKLVLAYLCLVNYIILVNYFAANKQIFALSYVLLFLYVEWQYSLPILKGITNTIAGIVTASVLEMLAYAPCHLFIHYLPDNVLTLLAVSLSLGAILLLVKNVDMDKVRKLLLYKERYSLLLLILCSVVVVYSILYFSKSKMLEFSDYFYFASCSVIILLSLYKLNRDHYETKIRTEYSEKYGEVIEQIRERQHKFSNQLSAIYAMHNVYDTYEELVQQQVEQTRMLEKYMLPNDVIILENPVVIAHVYQKICEAADNHVSLMTKFNCSLQDMEIPDIYFVEMIGTLFDNALEDVCSDSERRKMFLTILGDEERFVIKVGNEHEKIPFLEWKHYFERGFSTKGKGRGIGLYHLKKLVYKYGGNIEVYNDRIEGINYFTISLVFDNK